MIFLTARDEVPDRVAGFDRGRGRLRHQAVQPGRATRPHPGGAEAHRGRTLPGSRLRVADLELDEDAHEVRRAGAPVELTPTEYRLLRFLMVNAGRVVSKARSWTRSGSYGPDRDGGVVEPAVSYLRRKVDQGQPRLIHTVRGFGYVLRIPPP